MGEPSIQGEDYLPQVRDVLCSEFELDPADVVPEAHLMDDLDIDSIDAIDLLSRLQAVTGRALDPDIFKDARTVSDVVGVLQRT